MKGINSFVHQATKKAVRNHDAHKLDYIQNNSKIKWFREITTFDNNFTTPNHLRIPDLSAEAKNKWIILEHDTVKTHGELGYESQKTLERNKDYTRAKKPYFIINQDLCKMLQLDQAKLSTYLYYHTLSQINAGVWE